MVEIEAELLKWNMNDTRIHFSRMLGPKQVKQYLNPITISHQSDFIGFKVFRQQTTISNS